MKKILFSLLGLLVSIIIAFGIIGPVEAITWMSKPHHDFNPDKQSVRPDYSLAENWAALPEKEDLADMRPDGVESNPLLKEVDVFFIHPTGYLKGDQWTSPMNASSATEENTKWMMANQASVYSDCKVYAPRYRGSNDIFVFLNLMIHIVMARRLWNLHMKMYLIRLNIS